MDFNATIDLIIRELEEAREIIDDLKKVPGVPIIEVELARSKCKSAAEVIALLKELKTVERPETPERSATQPVQLNKTTDLKPEEAPSPAEKKKFNEKKTEPDLKPEKDKIIAAEEAKDTGKKEDKPFVAPIIADSFSHLANRFNERLGGNQEDDTSYMKRKPLTSLADAIGVNDRFFYIREIFNDNRESYNQAISQLEKAENMTDAHEILMSYTGEKKENEAFKQLLSLMRRKFSAHE